MTAQKDIRWIQRFNNFEKAFVQLKGVVELSAQRELSKLEEQGLVQAFEYTHELAWNVLKDFLEARGVTDMYGSRDATRKAFKAELIQNGEIWMRMIDSHNQTSHTYNETIAAEIVSAVIHTYFAEFEDLQARMLKLKETQE